MNLPRVLLPGCRNVQVSNVTNQSMKNMSAMSTIILPLTFVTGLFGMNIK